MRVRIALWILLLTSVALAQQNAGSILGTVFDPSGATIAGVKITVVEEQTGLSRTTLSAADGFYSVVQLPVGRYRVEAEQKGFQILSQNGVTVDVNQKVRLDLTLK